MITSGDDATDRQLRDTFGVTDDGIEKLKRMAEARKKRPQLTPRKGKAEHSLLGFKR